ncbi:MAG TPA: hypothetical protein VFL79_11935 [Terriglobia bacterium]|nr:hypothetical protein [Terriglobia bacterium]
MTHKGGNETKGGFYWKKGDWEIVTVEGKKGVLPGTEQTEYLRVPTLLFIPVILAMSVVYVVFLPFIGFAMLGKAMTTKTRQEWRHFRRTAGEEMAAESSGKKGTR